MRAQRFYFRRHRDVCVENEDGGRQVKVHGEARRDDVLHRRDVSVKRLVVRHEVGVRRHDDDLRRPRMAAAVSWNGHGGTW